MPTTRSARQSLTKVQAGTLVRFDSSRNEFVEPSPTVSVVSAFAAATVYTPNKTSTRSKRKSDEQNEEASGSGSTSKTFKKSRTGPSRSPSPSKGILRPAHFETNSKGLRLSPPTCPAPPSPSDAQPATPLDAPPSVLVPRLAPPEHQALVPAELSFDFEDAKTHLIGVDKRFEEVFARLKCRPFEDLTGIDPFRTLTQSILGQQISWLAARSITYKFVRLFNPHLPETRPEDAEKMTGPLFPTAARVATMPVATLRTAGLSARKAEYVLDLSQRFADGRLTTAKLLNADDDELAEILTAVKGIGRWTVDMFAIFSLRRSDILPTGDLGVQRGLVRWFLSLHAPQYAWALAPDAVEQTNSKKTETASSSKKKKAIKAKKSESDETQPDTNAEPVPEAEPESETPALHTRSHSRAATPTPTTPTGTPQTLSNTPGAAQTGVGSLTAAPPRGSSPDVSSVPPAGPPSTPAARPLRRSARHSSGGSPLKPTDVEVEVDGEVSTPKGKGKGRGKGKGDDERALGLPAMPTPFTASINRVLAGPGGRKGAQAKDEDDDDDVLPTVEPSKGQKQKGSEAQVDPLPEGLSVSILKARLDGKKKIKGAFLTPAEMTALTESWKPYRSIGVYYMWALADADKPK